WSNPRLDLFAWSVLVAAVSLGRLSESKFDFAGSDSVSNLHGLHRETHTRRHARGATVRLHPHGAREGIERTGCCYSSCIAWRAHAGDFLYRAGTRVSVNGNRRGRENFFVAGIGKLLHPGVAESRRAFDHRH